MLKKTFNIPDGVPCVYSSCYKPSTSETKPTAQPSSGKQYFTSRNPIADSISLNLLENELNSCMLCQQGGGLRQINCWAFTQTFKAVS